MNEIDLRSVPVPMATATYAPVSHGDVIRAIEDTLDQHNIAIAGRTYRANGKGTQVVGLMDLAKVTRGFGYRVTFRNSYDKSMSVGFSAGAQVLVCSNGMMVGHDIHGFSRKHTGSVREELQGYIQNCLKDFGPMMEKVIESADRMAQVKVSRTDAAELCGRMFIEEDIVNSTQLNIVKRELSEPSYEAFREPNLWSLYNHVTHSFKGAHPTEYMERHNRLHSYVMKEFNLQN